ncbi:DUF302 domain-containing protein [Halobacterium noricense]|uniref:DUF302 domain-containing protein n=1 Tax=Halobacterium noricense TaxID=223182 RepID=UPI001E5B909A|nr:DUF302 domain-containing protein [Halobacterium noricense]UHH26900.1 DUF302 domain-containing protein [Halobacterium noricense]UHH27118.1 DUF302 domain-containing protein [Halobacterium noricense]
MSVRTPSGSNGVFRKKIAPLPRRTFPADHRTTPAISAAVTGSIIPMPVTSCNPPLAYEGLTEETELGALLPCNVIVYETDDGEIMVSAVDPQQLVGIADNEALDSIANEVHDRFERVLANVADELESSTEI